MGKALLLDPKVLCIDELSLGLAPIIVGELMELVHQVHATGVTMLVVEQSLNVAAHLCERAVFLEKGEVRFEGPTRELMDRDDIARAVFLGGSPSEEAGATATSASNGTRPEGSGRRLAQPAQPATRTAAEENIAPT